MGASYTYSKCLSVWPLRLGSCTHDAVRFDLLVGAHAGLGRCVVLSASYKETETISTITYIEKQKVAALEW